MKVTTYTVIGDVARLAYYSVLVGISTSGKIFDVAQNHEETWDYTINK